MSYIIVILMSFQSIYSINYGHTSIRSCCIGYTNIRYNTATHVVNSTYNNTCIYYCSVRLIFILLQLSQLPVTCNLGKNNMDTVSDKTTKHEKVALVLNIFSCSFFVKLNTYRAVGIYMQGV